MARRRRADTRARVPAPEHSGSRSARRLRPAPGAAAARTHRLQHRLPLHLLGHGCGVRGGRLPGPTPPAPGPLGAVVRTGACGVGEAPAPGVAGSAAVAVGEREGPSVFWPGTAPAPRPVPRPLLSFRLGWAVRRKCGSRGKRHWKWLACCQPPGSLASRLGCSRGAGEPGTDPGTGGAGGNWGPVPTTRGLDLTAQGQRGARTASRRRRWSRSRRAHRPSTRVSPAQILPGDHGLCHRARSRGAPGTPGPDRLGSRHHRAFAAAFHVARV